MHQKKSLKSFNFTLITFDLIGILQLPTELLLKLYLSTSGYAHSSQVVAIDLLHLSKLIEEDLIVIILGESVSLLLIEVF